MPASVKINVKKFALLTVLIPSVLSCAQSTARSGGSGGRALVLGGGGPVGEAWESGVIAGLKEHGVDLTKAHLILGTSAGAIVGARLASRMPAVDFVDAALAPSTGPETKQASNQSPASPPPDLAFLGKKLEEMGTGRQSLQLIRRDIGEWALKLRPVVSEADFVASYRRRFPKDQWPGRAYECVTVDAGDGSMKMWNESSRVPLAIAVASSCALPGVFAPVTINGHRYMDGGVRSVTNADLARGCKTALVLAPTMGIDDPLAKSFTRPLGGELQALSESGCKVELIAPDAASVKAFGNSLGDESRRASALNAGRIEGQKKAGETAKLWSD